MSMMMTKRIQIFFFLLFFLIACQRYDCNDFELEIKSRISKDQPKAKVSLATYTSIVWDELYIIKGPRVERDVERITGLKAFDRYVPDDSRLYAFLYKKQIVSHTVSRCYDINFGVMGDKGFVRYQYTDTLTIQMKPTEGGMNYYILKR